MNRRTKRVASLLRSELARVICSELSDPDLVGVSVTDVELTDDLKQARVYFESSENHRPGDVAKGLKRATAFLRRKIGSELSLRYVPELNFVADIHGESVNRVMKLLSEIQEEVR